MIANETTVNLNSKEADISNYRPANDLQKCEKKLLTIMFFLIILLMINVLVNHWLNYQNVKKRDKTISTLVIHAVTSTVWFPSNTPLSNVFRSRIMKAE